MIDQMSEGIDSIYKLILTNLSVIFAEEDIYCIF